MSYEDDLDAEPSSMDQSTSGLVHPEAEEVGPLSPSTEHLVSIVLEDGRWTEGGDDILAVCRLSEGRYEILFARSDRSYVQEAVDPVRYSVVNIHEEREGPRLKKIVAVGDSHNDGAAADAHFMILRVL